MTMKVKILASTQGDGRHLEKGCVEELSDATARALLIASKAAPHVEPTPEEPAEDAGEQDEKPADEKPAAPAPKTGKGKKK